MNENKDIIVSLDIGTTKICCLIAKKLDNEKIDILGVGMAQSIGLLRGVIANVADTEKAIQKAVNKAELQSGLKVKKVIVGIAGQHIKSLKHRNYLSREENSNEITQGDIDYLVESAHNIVLPPGDEIIHVLPQMFKVDNEEGITDPVGMCGTNLQGDFLIITGQANSIKNIGSCVERAGLEVAGLILEPIASSISVLNNREKEAGVALVDIGGGTTDLAIFEDNIIRHTAVIPFGGNVITDDIKEGCAVLRDDAEKLKINYGSALALKAHKDQVIVVPDSFGTQEPREIPMTNLALIIQARVEEIMDEVYHHIRKSGFENKLLAGIVLTGGGSMLKNIDKITEYMTGIRTRLGDVEKSLLDKDKNKLNEAKYATAVGLALKGLELINEQELDGRFVGLGPDTQINTSHPEPVDRFDEEEQPKKQRSFIDMIRDIFRKDSPDYDED